MTTMYKALYSRDDVERLHIKKRRRKNIEIASMHWYKNSKIILKSAKEDWLQQAETIQTTQALTKQK